MDKTKTDSVPTITPGTVSREVDGEMVVVLPDNGEFLVLNSTGMSIYRLSDGTRTLGEIARQMTEMYDVESEQMLSDVITFVDDMIERGVLSLT